MTYQIVLPLLSRGEKRKMVIVEAAIDILARQGLSQLTFEAIGKKCHISKSHVAYHFPSLEKLVNTSVSYVYTVGQKTVSEYIQNESSKGKGDLLKAYVHGTFHWIETYPEHSSVAALLGYLATWDRGYRDIQSEIKRVGQQRISALIQAMTGKRCPTAQADAIQSLLMGKILYYSTTATNRSIRQVRAETWRAIQELLP